MAVSPVRLGHLKRVSKHIPEVSSASESHPEPSGPGESPPEALTDSVRDPLRSHGSCHPVKAAAFRRNQSAPPVAS